MSDYTSLFSHIKRCAEIPSFSSFEERIHPYIESAVSVIEQAEIEKVPVNNLVIRLNGKKKDKTVVLTAHLDKIDHWGSDAPTILPFTEHEDFLEGQLDNTVGLGVCLTLLEKATVSDYPNLIVLFSEMEESKGLKEHPERLKNKGRGIIHGQGADELSRYLIEEGIQPEAIITCDTTPLFKGQSGVALYSKWWEMFKQTPTTDEIAVTDKVVQSITQIDPNLTDANNTNDYMIYGRIVNRNSLKAVASLAIEPAIFPYHQKGEKVFKKDIVRVVELLDKWLISL